MNQKLKPFLIYSAFLIIFVLFYHLTSEVIDKETLGLDIWLNSQFISLRNPYLTNLMIAISDFGEIGGLILVGLLVGFLGLKKQISSLLEILTVVGLAGVSVWVLKKLVSRSRPELAFRLVNETDFSYPSGHSTIAFTVFPVLAIYILRHKISSKVLRISLVIILLVFPFIIAFSRLYLGVHYFTDVLAGAIIGLSLSSLYYFLSQKETKII